MARHRPSQAARGSVFAGGRRAGLGHATVAKPADAVLNTAVWQGGRCAPLEPPLSFARRALLPPLSLLPTALVLLLARGCSRGRTPTGYQSTDRHVRSVASKHRQRLSVLDRTSRWSIRTSS